MERPAFRILACASLLSGSLVACAAVFGFESLQEGALDAAPAAPDAPAAEAGPAEERGICPDALEPPDVPPVAIPAHTFLALDALRPGPLAEERQGLDLDCTYSRGADTSSCKTNLTDDPRSLSEIITDKLGGIDNAGQVLMFGSQGRLQQFDDTNAISKLVRAGRSGLVFDLANFVGLADQKSIRIDAWPAARVLAPDEDSCAAPARTDAGMPEPGDGGLQRTPQFTDRWCVDIDSWTAIATSEYQSTTAWVRDRQLVALFPQLAVPISYDAEFDRYAYARLEEVWLVADLSLDAKQHAVLSNGTLAGRWPEGEILNETASIGATGPTCKVDSAFMLGARAVVCAARDIGSKAVPDVCSALSVGMSFTAYQVESKPAPTELRTYQERCRQSGYNVDGDFVVRGFDCTVPDAGSPN